MDEELAPVDFQGFWRRLQQLGLNAYESRSYLVLLGHPRFKALELAARARVPRQKIYEILDSLVEKGFAQVVQERTKLFSAVEPSLAIPGYLSRRREALDQELPVDALRDPRDERLRHLAEPLQIQFPAGQERQRIDFYNFFWYPKIRQPRLLLIIGNVADIITVQLQQPDHLPRTVE